MPNRSVMIRSSRATTIFKLSKLGRSGLSTPNFKNVYNEIVKRRETHRLKRYCSATHACLRRLESISRNFCFHMPTQAKIEWHTVSHARALQVSLTYCKSRKWGLNSRYDPYSLPPCNNLATSEGNKNISTWAIVASFQLWERNVPGLRNELKLLHPLEKGVWGRNKTSNHTHRWLTKHCHQAVSWPLPKATGSTESAMCGRRAPPAEKISSGRATRLETCHNLLMAEESRK